MFSEPAIRLENLGKCYHVYDKPRDRLLQMVFRGRRQYYREFWALRGVNLQVMPGEVIGVVGRNGSGKSTLLQLVCGTLYPTTGSVDVSGRITALLELGAGFNPEFSGRENVFLSASLAGLSNSEIEARYDEIVEFSGIRDFIDQPVKIYSSGMYVRLAFSVAINVDPDILIIDEALSVGDGEFARKSFDRIMALRDAGKTILFCSHSLYQVEALCDRAIWLDRGCIRMMGKVAEATAAYQAELNAEVAKLSAEEPACLPQKVGGRLLKVHGLTESQCGKSLQICSLQSTLTVIVEFSVDPRLPTPCVGLGFANSAGITIASVSSFDDGAQLSVDVSGSGRATIAFPQIPLLKGDYSVTAVLCCERAVHIYDIAERCLTLHVTQQRLTQGLVELPHHWMAP